MKTGKTLKITGFDKAKVTYGTVDFKNFKSVYLNIQTWATPKLDLENNATIVNNLSRNIKHVIYDLLNLKLFEPNFIVDLDLRTSGVFFGKRSFANLEITFYVKPTVAFKSTELKNEFKNLSNSVYKKIINSNQYFDFSYAKNSPINELTEIAYIYR